MAGVLLGLFPVLFLFNTRLAWVDLGVAIVVLCAKRASGARQAARRRVYDDAA